MKTMKMTINAEQKLYVHTHEDGSVTCLGFDVAERRRRAVLAWLGFRDNDIGWVTPGTDYAYDQYQYAMKLGAEHAGRSGLQCPAELTPQLNGYVGRKVCVTSRDGTERTFIVGRSTGWLPVNIEIEDDADGGPAAFLAEGDVVSLCRD